MDELLVALLGEFIETCDHIGLSYYEERAQAWLDLLGLKNEGELRADWTAQRIELWKMYEAKWHTHG